METYKSKQAWFLKQESIWKKEAFSQHNFSTKTYFLQRVCRHGRVLLAAAGAMSPVARGLVLWRIILTVCQLLLPREKNLCHVCLRGHQAPRGEFSQNSQGTHILRIERSVGLGRPYTSVYILALHIKCPLDLGCRCAKVGTCFLDIAIWGPVE